MMMCVNAAEKRIDAHAVQIARGLKKSLRIEFGTYHGFWKGD
jgi:hypothetical protein